MADVPDTSSAQYMQPVVETGRSEEFKQYRSRVVDCCVEFMELLKQVKNLGKKLENGMSVQDWPVKVQSEVNTEGYTKKLITKNETGAILRQEPGTSYFEMCEDRPDGVVHFLALQVDKIEAMFGEINPLGVPNMISGIYEEFTDKDGSKRYFGVDVMTDGSVRLKEFNDSEKIKTSQLATEAEQLQGLPEMIASIRGDTVQ